MLELLFSFTSSYLIEFMVCALFLALVVRFLAFRSSQFNQVFFYSFIREVEKSIQLEEFKADKKSNIESYMSKLLEKVSKQLPERSLRFSDGLFSRSTAREDSRVTTAKNVVSLKEYVGGSQSLIHAIQGEFNAFKSMTPPDFNDLTNRVMTNDRHWSRLLGMPIDSVSRIIDTSPGLFIVLGIFGTFVGISQALPQIAAIDFSDTSTSTAVLSSFVGEVTFAMRTSVVGIIASIVLSFLNALSPITAVRNGISSKLEQCLEHIWFYIHQESSDETAESQLFQARMIELLTSIDKKLAGTSKKKGAA